MNRTTDKSAQETIIIGVGGIGARAVREAIKYQSELRKITNYTDLISQKKSGETNKPT